MKRVIGGLLYNSETATCLAGYEEGYPGDFHYIAETLFKTRNGRYFLQYAGGALTRYAEDYGPSISGSGAGIKPIAENEALQWCEDHAVDVAIVSRFFQIEEA